VVQLNEVVGVDVAVPAAEELNDDGALKREQQLVGVRVHLPRAYAGAARSKNSEVPIVERNKVMERKLGVGASDVHRAMSIHDWIIVGASRSPTPDALRLPAIEDAVGRRHCAPVSDGPLSPRRPQ
jgi:hypothetical protein